MNALLLSGGMDSTCIAWWKRPNLAIFIDYGQKPAEAEELAAKTVCEEIGIELEVVRVDCSALGSGDMAGTPSLDIAPVPEWWPYRNQLLLTIAGACALRFGVSELLIGALKTDSQHADGTLEFVDAMSKVMALQEGSISIIAPAIGLSAEELVKVTCPHEVVQRL